MNRRLRLVITAVILVISLSLLIWGYKPNPREIRIQLIAPTEMQLPTPQ